MGQGRIHRLIFLGLLAACSSTPKTNPETVSALVKDGQIPIDRRPKLEVETVKTETLRRLAGDRAKKILEPIDEADIDQAKLRDKSVAAAVLIDKMRLLGNESTQNVSIDDRQAMRELMPIMLKEAARRGMLPKTDPVTGEVTWSDDDEPSDAPVPAQDTSFVAAEGKELAERVPG